MKSYFSTHLGLRYMWNIFIQILIWPIFKSSHSLSSGTEVHLHISLGQWDEAREGLWTKQQGCGRKLLAKGGEVGIPGCLLTFVEEGGFKAFTAPSFPCKWLVWKCYPAHCGLFTAGSLQNRDSAVGRTVFRVTQQIMKLVLLRNLFRNLFINYIIARYPPVKKTFQSFGINTYVLACDMVTSLKWIARPLVYPCLRTLSFSSVLYRKWHFFKTLISPIYAYGTYNCNPPEFQMNRHTRISVSALTHDWNMLWFRLC